MDLENFIKDLSPELQEKARQCASVDELLALAKDEKIPLSDEAMEAIAGGKGDPRNCGSKKGPPCPKCRSTNTEQRTVRVDPGVPYTYYICHDCGYKWDK